MSRSFSTLRGTFSEGELSTLPGDRELRHEALRPFFEELHERQLVYHERFTALVEVVEMKLTAEGFEMEVRSVATIKRWDRGVMTRVPDRWRFGNTWDYCTLSPGRRAMENHPAGFLLWPEADLVRRVGDLVAAAEVKAAEDLLWGRNSLQHRQSQVA